jgi:hypothetical protein
MLAQKRLKGKPNIFETAKMGDVATLQDYILVDGACVNQKNSM